jgi:DNA-binding NarL/FixJ family response regulator
MRVVIVGPAARRERLRRLLPEGVDVVAEASTMNDARRVASGADAFLVAVRGAADEDPIVEDLTPREREVLALVADGLSNKAIAGRLGVSDETVKFHLASIFGKLGASNRTDAVSQALRRGLVPL